MTYGKCRMEQSRYSMPSASTFTLGILQPYEGVVGVFLLDSCFYTIANSRQGYTFLNNILPYLCKLCVPCMVVSMTKGGGQGERMISFTFRKITEGSFQYDCC